MEAPEPSARQQTAVAGRLSKNSGETLNKQYIVDVKVYIIRIAMIQT